MLCFVYQKIFGAFPVFHLIIQLFKIAIHSPIAKLLTHLLACVITTVENTALLVSTSPLGSYNFTWDLGKKEKALLPSCSRFISPLPSRRCFYPSPMLLNYYIFGYLLVCSSHDFCYTASHSFHKGSRNASACKHIYVPLLLS